jgi:UDP-N-acetyl-2-amino-2-deoxyglucuronate dehydrogenase
VEAEVVAICDPYLEEESVDGIPVFKDIEQMLISMPQIDVVNICTPNGLHAEQSIICINHGKHVVVEKPMSLTKKDAENVIFHALNKHVKIFCVMQNRYTANAQFLKHLITNNQLGNVKEVVVNLFWNRDKRYYFQEKACSMPGEAMQIWMEAHYSRSFLTLLICFTGYLETYLSPLLRSQT